MFINPVSMADRAEIRVRQMIPPQSVIPFESLTMGFSSLIGFVVKYEHV